MKKQKVNRKDFLSRLSNRLKQRVSGDREKLSNPDKVKKEKYDLAMWPEGIYNQVIHEADAIFGKKVSHDEAEQLALSVEKYVNEQLEDKIVAYPEDVSHVVFNSMMEEAGDIICSGQNISIHGFGTFYLAMHAGHPVRFKSDKHQMKEYVVLKFKASDTFVKRVRELYERGELPVGGDTAV